jgi:hypothetical protein
MQVVMDRLEVRQMQLEVQQRRCVCEAKRHRASGSKSLFRAKMLEHRRIQSQIMQLQKCKEGISSKMDALSNHELNQTYLMAMKEASSEAKQRLIPVSDAESTIEQMNEAIHGAKELSEFLSQTIEPDEALDEDLEQEFLDEVEHLAVLPSAVVDPPQTAPATINTAAAAVASG